MPSEKQILGSKIRAAYESYFDSNKTPCRGGFLVPSTSQCLNHLSKLFGMKPVEIGYFLTYARYCTHPWSDGACDKCPE